MGNLFGTDGVRGVANRELSAELAFKLGRAGALVLSEGNRRPRIVLGRDTRISGDMLEAALVAGICSMGGDVLKVGVVPTPGVAVLTRLLGADAGVVISASHNPMEDNGIKFFGGNGFKLPDAVEEKIEQAIATSAWDATPAPVGKEVGRVVELPDAPLRYIDYLEEAIPSNLTGLRIVVDCANGASYRLAPNLLGDLGAEVVVINASPDGVNINSACGSTHPAQLQQAVVHHGADLGLAYDGDADRVIAVDERGNLVDGDAIMVICGLERKRQQRLLNDRVVVTVMSNLGLHQAFQKEGVEVIQTKVGDRYVLEEMLKSGAALGGEQSGHVIFLDNQTTGDGLLTSLELLQVISATGADLSELAKQMQRLPQLMVNVRVRDKNGLDHCQPLKEAVQAAQEQLAGRGRILVRPSGTEPVLRLMAEGPDEGELKSILGGLKEVVERYLT